MDRQSFRDSLPGYSASTYNGLDYAFDMNDDPAMVKSVADSLEQSIEQHPIEAAEVVSNIESSTPNNEIPDSLEKEVQEAATNSPSKEVKNSVVEEEVKEDPAEAQDIINRIGSFINSPLYDKLDTDYDPRVEANNEYEYPVGVGNVGVLTSKDEDFAGPDELPAIIKPTEEPTEEPTDELPAIIKPTEELTEVIPEEEPEAYAKYNFNWDWEDITPEDIEEAVDNNEAIPEEERGEVKRQLLNYKKHHVDTLSSSSMQSTKIPGSSFGGAFKSVGGGVSSTSTPSSSVVSAATAPTIKQEPKAATINPAKVRYSKPKQAATGSKIQAASSGYRTSNGATFGSGSVDKRGTSLIKVSSNKLPNGEANNQADVVGLSKTNNLRESYLQQLIRRIKSIDEETAEEYGFSSRYNTVEYNDIPIEDYNDFKEIEEILMEIGV